MHKSAGLIDYSTVTKKSLLIDRILQLQKSIAKKQENLESEHNMRIEFQAMVSASE